MLGQKTFIKCVIVIIFGLIFASTAILPEKAAAADLLPLEIPQVVDMTGPYKSESTGWVKIFQVLEKDINEKGGIAGRKVILKPYDCRYDVGVSTSILGRLINLTPKPAVIGGSIGPFFVASAKKMPEPDYRIPLLAPAAYEAFVKEPSWIFSFGALYYQSLGTFLDWVQKNWKEARPIRLAFYTLNTPGGREPMRLKPWLEQKGIEVVAEEFVDPVPVDITSIMMRFQQTKPDFIYGITPVSAYTKLLTEMERRNMRSKLILPGFMPFSLVLKYVDKKTLEGHYQVSAFNTYLDESSPGIKSMNELFKKNEALKDLWPPDTGDMWAYGHVMVAKALLEKAVEKYGSWDKVTGETIFEMLNSGVEVDTGGIVSHLKWNAQRRVGPSAIKILQCQNGEPVDMAGWMPFSKGLSEEEFFHR
ncbi:MAG: ABC transporter substrate-binding protein [Desulfobacteraceae bacterium]|nr:MAG: ABC transporter substrate-binding protein [Desulfobacteraceae bacterium]